MRLSQDRGMIQTHVRDDAIESRQCLETPPPLMTLTEVYGLFALNQPRDDDRLDRDFSVNPFVQFAGVFKLPETPIDG